ncbi:hypothetical protein DNI29_20945 [Hymenobacter sediminis]|uniref:hypothetical protein n=1 Tax=Hymenobacter sediminis TaxID=2218621 RepID=UPI000F502CD2|nr:hypothetical protein [Hymenobacter sediminis]RPD44601.1 hypothetical protein DNI29_20945 [Hymenobacter sediminis]
MPKVCCLIGFLLLFAACGRQEPTGSVKLTDFPQCYAYDSEDDTIYLHIITLHPSVTGRITFNAEQRESGPISGVVHGDTLLADWQLEYNGKPSSIAAPVAFLRTDKGFLQGFGDIKEQNGMFSFKDRSAIRFDTTRILQPAYCPQ